MSKPTKEDNDASLLATENPLFGRLMDAMQDQSQPCMPLLTVIFTTYPILVIRRSHCTIALKTPAVPLIV
jgi:hypothetical protein